MNFLVSCVGEYMGSGTGSGGLVLASQSGITEIDRIDCTGLFSFDGLFFRVIRKLRLIVVYSLNGVQNIIQLPEIEDAHDILVDHHSIYCVSTGKNKIFVFDHFGRKKEEVVFPGSGDAWHINCLRRVGEDLYCTAFGIFSSHREWATVDYSKKGIIYNINKRQVVQNHLNAPHNPLFLDQKWMVCNSLDHSFSIFPAGDVVNIDCGGFTRGLTYDATSIYVGVSADRKLMNKGVSRILRLNRRTYEIDGQITVPFPEIYDIIQISHDEADLIKLNLAKFSLEELSWQSTIQELKMKTMASFPSRLRKFLRNRVRRFIPRVM